MHNSPRSVSRLITVGITSALFASTFSAVASAESADLSRDPLSASPGRAEKIGVQTTCDAKPIFFGYYRTWRDQAIQLKDGDKWKDNLKIKLTDIPEHVDMVSLFHVEDNQESDTRFWDTFREKYQPELKNAVPELFGPSARSCCSIRLKIKTSTESVLKTTPSIGR